MSTETRRAEPLLVPLSEAIIEVRFPGDARIDQFRGEFQQRIRGTFPLLLAPTLEQNDSLALLHYRFSNETQTRSVDLALHSLMYSSKEYPGWETFSEEFLEFWNILNRKLTPPILTRVAIRFENQFDQAWRNHLNLVNLPTYLMPVRNTPSYHRSITQLAKGDHSLIINLLMQESEEMSSLSLDYDAFTNNVSIEKLEEALSTLHQSIEFEFLSAVTPDLAKSLSIS